MEAVVNGTEITTSVHEITPVLNCYSENASVELLWDCIVPREKEWILIVAYMFTFIVGIMGNLLVCFAVWWNRDMRTITNIFMVNLSVADLTVMVIPLPANLLVDVTGTWFLGVTMCKITIALTTVCISVSVLTLCAISVERWYAICHPLRFHSSVRRTRQIIFGIWLVSICIAVPEFLASTVRPYHAHTVIFSMCYPALWDMTTIMIFQICIMVMLYFIPLLMMGFTYTQIAIVLSRGNKPGEIELRYRQPMFFRKQSHGNDKHVDGRKKAAKLLVAVVVVFALCFLPNHTLNILRYTDNLQNVPNVHIFALIAHWSIFFNSCINPVIYNFMSDTFRKEFRVAMTMCVRCRHGQHQTRGIYQVGFTGKGRMSSRQSSSNTSNCAPNITNINQCTVELN